MKKLVFFFFLLLFLTPHLMAQRQQGEKRLASPVLKNGAPVAYTTFGRPKVTKGLMLSKPEGIEYDRQVWLGHYGVKPDSSSEESALYFQSSTDELVTATGTFYVSIQYRDQGRGAIHLDYISKSGKEEAAMKSQRFFMGNSGVWVEHTFTLQDAVLDHSLPGDSDFRIRGTNLLLRAVGLSRTPLGKTGQGISPLFRQEKINLPAGYTFALFPDGDRWWDKEDLLQQKSKLYRSWGTTNVVDTIDINKVYVRKKTYDFENYAKRVRNLISHDLHWTPRFKIGDARYFPSALTEQLQQAVDIERRKEGPMFSLWEDKLFTIYNQMFRDMVRWIPERRMPLSVLSFASDWGPFYYSNEHNDSRAWPGLWAGDPIAIRDFQQAMRNRYRNLKNLNQRWGQFFHNWNEVVPALDEAQSLEHREDTLRWYQSRMTEVASKITQAYRTYFPSTKLIIEIGDEFLLGATDISAFVNIAAKHNASILMVCKNEVPTTSYTWQLLSYECRRTGVPFGLRVDKNVNWDKILASLYSLGSEQGRIYFYNENDMAQPNVWDRFYHAVQSLQQTAPSRKIAVLFPRRSILAKNPLHYDKSIQRLREQIDFDLIDERYLSSISPQDYPLIISPWGWLWSSRTISSLYNVVRGGSALLAWTEYPWQSEEGVDFNEKFFSVKIKEENGRQVMEPRVSPQQASFDPKGPLPVRQVVQVGASGTSQFLTGEWTSTYGENAAQQYNWPFSSFRFTGREAGVVMHVRPQRKYRLEIKGFIPEGQTVHVFLDNQRLGSIEKEGLFHWNSLEDAGSSRKQGQITVRNPEVRLKFRGSAWSTGQVLGATQTQRVGMVVEKVALLPHDDPRDALDRYEEARVDFDIQRKHLRSSWLREVGRGVTVLAPSDYVSEGLFSQMIAQVLENPSMLHPRFDFSFPPAGSLNQVFVSSQNRSYFYMNLQNQPVRISQRRIQIPEKSFIYLNRTD